MWSGRVISKFSWKWKALCWCSAVITIQDASLTFSIGLRSFSEMEERDFMERKQIEHLKIAVCSEPESEICSVHLCFSTTTLERQWEMYVNRLAEGLRLLLKVQRSRAERHAGVAPLKSCLYQQGRNNILREGRSAGNLDISLYKTGK